MSFHVLPASQAARQPGSQSVSRAGKIILKNFTGSPPACGFLLADLRTAAAGSFHHWLPFWLFGKTIHKFAAEETAAPKTIVIKTMNCLASPLKTTESLHITRTEQQQQQQLKLNFNFTPSR